MKKTKKIISTLILTTVLICILTSFICAVSLYAYATKCIDASIDFDKLMSSRGLTSILYRLDSNENEIEMRRLHGIENRIWTDMDSIPISVVNAFVAIEDHRFFEHNGVDVKRTLGAVFNFFKPSSKQFGGSTITQQLIKNITGENDITIKRKLIEIMRSIELEKHISKQAILEAYLNTVYLSNGCFGIETASEYFFSKSASDLTLSEAASLAGILKYPYKYDPVRYPENNIERRNVVLSRMFELGMISDIEYSNAISEPITLNINSDISKNETLSWFEETVIDEVAADLCKKYDYDKETAVKMIYSGGLKIVTTVDENIQSALDNIYQNSANFPTSGILTAPQSSAVIIDPHTGELLAIAGARGKKASDRIFNLATRLTRSPGSVIKPLSVYAPAIEKGIITWSSVFDDVPVYCEKSADGSFTAWPKNNPRVYSGLTNVCHAVETSTNTVSVKILQKLGARNSFEFLKKLGISTLIDSEKTRSGSLVSDVAPAPLALGAVTNGCTLYQITGAYTMFANGGKHISPHSYTEVYNRNGELILKNDAVGTDIISEESADIMTRLMKVVVEKGTASGMNISKYVDTAGKTGTSNSNTDRWFIGYTPDFICGIWYGYVDARDIGYYKSNPACHMFDKVMRSVYNIYPKLKSNKFSHSKNVVSCLYCRDSGLLGATECTHDPRGCRMELGYFKK